MKITVFCHNVKVKMPALQPKTLNNLFVGNDEASGTFRSRIRNYNCAFSFALFGVKLATHPGRIPYCFRITRPSLPHDDNSASF